MEAVRAVAGDLEWIRKLLYYYAERGVLAPRTESYLKEHLSEFYVCRVDGGIVGCSALHRIDDETAQVRCFAVMEDFKGMGAGKALLEKSLGEARARGFRRVFTLSLEKDFFRKNGFARMSKLSIPLKTFKSEPEVNPKRFARWMKLFLKMLAKDSAHQRTLN